MKYFHPGNRVIAVSSPTLTYTQFYILVFVVMAMISLVAWRVVLRVRRKAKNIVEK